MKHTAQQIYQVIAQAQHILLVPHPHPDGDTLGSVSALYTWLTQLDKKVSTYCKTSMSEKLEYLPHSEYIKSEAGVFEHKDIDLVIVCDSGDLAYAGIDQHITKLPKHTKIINFDHHKTNTYFGHHNMVIDTESSTTAVLYRFFYHNNVTINKTMATGLLTGLLTDTDHFSNSATSKTSLYIASKLMESGAHVHKIRNHIVKDKSIEGLRLWGAVLSNIDYHKPLDMVYTTISQKDIKQHNAGEADVEGVANFLNSLNEGSFSLILKEQKNKEIKGSFRTTKDDVDVSAMAKHFGGGGHQKAAGFTISVPIHKAVNHIITALELFLKK